MTREEAIKILTHIRNGKSDLMLMDALDMAIKALEQEPKYCDRNICIKNEYNGIGCDECEVTKSQEPKTGHWIKYDKEYFTIKRLTPATHSIRECSECHTKIADFCGEMRYCPNCGSAMKEE